MKKISILLLLITLFFVSLVVNAEPTKYKIEAKTLSSFQIYMEDSDPIRKALPIIEFDGVKGHRLYRFEKYSINGIVSYRLYLDKQGKREELRISDKDYQDQIYYIFTCQPNMSFVGDNSINKIALVAYFDERADFSNTTFDYCRLLIFNKRLNQRQKLTCGNNREYIFPSGSICYIDDKYQIEWREPINNNMVVTRREAINPDDFSPMYKIPGLSDISSGNYKSNAIYGTGYVKVTANSDLFSINGIQYDFNPNTDQLIPILAVNGKTMVCHEFLRNLLNTQSQYLPSILVKGSRDVEIQRLYYDRNTSKIVTLTVRINDASKKYIDNGITKEFSAMPYYANSVGIMVPLKEVCDALKAKVIYRPLDGTILIARFFEN
jgi:hypothetical protein